MAIFTSQKFHAGEKILNSKMFTDSMVLRTTSHIFLADMFKQYQLASLGTIHPCSNYSVKTVCMEISTTVYNQVSFHAAELPGAMPSGRSRSRFDTTTRVFETINFLI